MTPAALRSQYTHLFGSGALPALEVLFKYELEQHVSARAKIANMKSAKGDIYQSSELHDLETYSEVAEGSEYSFKRPKQGASKTLTMKKWGLGVSVSEEMVDDAKFDVVADMIKKLARSGKETQEVNYMNLFNNGFGSSATAPDGQPIFDTAHTNPSGGTFRNELSTAADLSESTLQTAMTDFEKQFVGDGGIIYNIKPKMLVVPSELKRYAQELVGSDGKPDTADNNLNSLKEDGLVVVSSPHLSDTDAWFLVSAPSDHGLIVAKRSGIETKAAGPDVGFATDSIYYKARFREEVGCISPLGLFGSPGA